MKVLSIFVHTTPLSEFFLNEKLVRFDHKYFEGDLILSMGKFQLF